MTKDDRQAEFVDKFALNNGIGTLEATTAFGKTITAMKVIKKMREKNPARTVLVIVPRIHLKEQWEKVSKVWKVGDITVKVINSAAKTKYVADLLILDEIHRYAAETFSEIFKVVEYRFILGLTATMKRLDRKHRLLEKYCPIIDRVSTLEARTNGWIADYIEFNFGIQLDPKDMVIYKRAEEVYEKSMDTFSYDFGLMQRCAMYYKPRYKDGRALESSCSELARAYGWKGCTAERAYDFMKAGERMMWKGDGTNPYTPFNIYLRAINGLKSLKKIKSIIQHDSKKLYKAVELIHFLEMRTMTFAETIAAADWMTEELKAHGVKAVSYHSKMSNITVAGKRLSKVKSAAHVIEQVRLGEYSVLNAARSLDEGIDIPDMQLGVRTSGSSSPTQMTQRRGRIARKHGSKRAIMVNLYLLDTKEVGWLSKSQGYDEEINWVESIPEILEQLEE